MAEGHPFSDTDSATGVLYEADFSAVTVGLCGLPRFMNRAFYRHVQRHHGARASKDEAKGDSAEVEDAGVSQEHVKR